MESIDGPPAEKKSNDSCAHLNPVVDTLIAECASKLKASAVYCGICEAKNKRIHACLECEFFGCFDQNKLGKEKVSDSHMKDHAMENDHYFAININYGLFCFKCNDYVYTETFKDISDDLDSDYKPEARKIKGSQSYLSDTPKQEEIVKLENKRRKISDDSYNGLRGIENIRGSCYMSCILQVFMHNPFLRDFLLSGQHKCFKQKTETCSVCEMFRVFQEFHSRLTLPYNPKSFFEAFQKDSSSRREYLRREQQDAFEIFQEIVAGLESSCQETHETDNCNCMIHQMFYGVNENSRKCSACEASSLLPLDHFVDISIDLKRDNSLVEILKRNFSKPELLIDYKCSNCKETATTYKYTTIKKLPEVICFRVNCLSYPFNRHFKHDRHYFKHQLRKLSAAFEFKESIDMSDYLNSKIHIDSSNGGYLSDSSAVQNICYPFGVILHKGNAHGGYYLTYIKQRENQWFECEDEEVNSKSLDEVLNCEPYLLFYHKQL